MLLFELKNRLWRWSTLVYFTIFFVLTFLLAALCAGIFGIPFNFNLSDQLPFNSPRALHEIIGCMGFFGLMIVAPVFGQSINQDFETGFHQILFSTPISKKKYFFVRTFTSFLASIVIFLSIGLAVWTVTLIVPSLAPNRFLNFAAPYFTLLIPNVLAFGLLFTAVIAVTKSMKIVYISNIVLFLGWMMASKITSDLDNKLIGSLVDPFGWTATLQCTKYWSIAQQLSQTVPLSGLLLFNRLLWLSVGFLLFGWAYYRFNPFVIKKEKKKPLHIEEPKSFEWKKFSLQPRSWKVFWQLSFLECKYAFSNIYFLIILGCGLLYLLIISGQVGKIYGTETLPVTYHVLELAGGIFRQFIILLTAFYAGELIWRDKEKSAHELVDSKPISNLFLYLSKLQALVLLQLVLIAITCASCILIQLFKGYTHFEWDVYAKHLLFYSLPAQIFACVWTLFIHTVVKQKAIGHFLVLLYFGALLGLSFFGWNHCLLTIGVLPAPEYSDMNGFGPLLWPFSILTCYWAAFHLVLAALTVLLWHRSAALISLKDRLQKARFSPSFLGSSVFAFIALGAFVFYNTNILNEYKTNKTNELEQATYEINFKRFEKDPHPDLVAIKVWIDLFPESSGMRVKGVHRYQNKSSQPIQTILLYCPESASFKLSWSKKAKLIQGDMRTRVYEFDEPLGPQEELQLDFEATVVSKGFQNDGFSKKIVENGIFFNSMDFFPIMGYCSWAELISDKARKRYGLPERSCMGDPEDSQARLRNYLTNEGAWIDFEAIVSTCKDQTAVAPGYLVKEWQEGDRRIFHYKMDKPILPFYSILSAHYSIFKDRWNDVDIEIYHHPAHTQNLARMVRSIKRSLSYYTKEFSPYQFRQVRILEFPRYAMMAQAFPNTVPYSEGIGFIAKVNDDPACIDYPFYVTAHEVAHQWWAHQVIGANAKGATMLSESLAQYSAMMVMEKEYGPEQMKKFLRYELDKYLIGRGFESKKELPLVLNENQEYIHYHKGSLAFYALKDRFGEDWVNQILRDFIRDTAFQSAPYPTARDLVQRFKEKAPDELKYIIEDLFETVTMFQHLAVSATYQEQADGKFEVDITTLHNKFRDDQIVPLNDLIDVGVYDEAGRLQYLEKHKIVSGTNVFRIQVDRKPSKAGVDPLNKTLNKLPDQNLAVVKLKTP